MSISLTHKEIDAIRKRDATDPNLPMYRKYARGDQNVATTEFQRQAFAGRKVQPTADNVLHLILATAASRLEFTGWQVDPRVDTISAEDATSSETAIKAAKQVNAYLGDLFVRNQMGRKQFDTHYAQLRDGNHGIVLRWKPDGADVRRGRVVIHRERWFDSISEIGLFVGTDESDEPVWAVKEWVERDAIGKEVRRRVVYYDDRFERYRKTGRGWELYGIAGDEQFQVRTGVLPWRRPGTNDPLGLPVVYFPNGTDDDSSYGRSELVGLLGLQDDLNGIQVDVTAAAAFTGFQMYWLTGYKRTDGDSEFMVGPGRLVEVPNPDARMGVLPGGDMSGLTAAHKYKRETIAVDTQTPMHAITGQWPSGDALIRADMPMIDKVKRLGAINGPQWVMVGHRATEIYNAFGAGGLDEDAPITAIFSPPERLDDLTRSEVAAKRIGLYNALMLISDPILFLKAAVETELLTQKEAEQVLADREARAAEFAAQTAAADDTEDDGEDTEPPAGEFS
jgi:hypothetical protein